MRETPPPPGERSQTMRMGTGRPPLRVDLLRRMIRTGALTRAQKILEKVHSADIAEMFPNLSLGERRTLLELLFQTARAGKTLRELPQEILTEALALLDDDKVAAIVGRVEPDDSAYFVEALVEERRPKVLSLLDIRKRHDIERVLGSPEESAGSFMTTRIATVPDSATCQEGLEKLRASGDQVEDVFYTYAVDSEGRLTGVVPIRKLITAAPDRPVRDVMIPEPVSINEHADQEEAAGLISKYNLLALPVVDDAGKLLGAVTVDDVIDVIQEEATEDMYRMAGLEEEDRVFSPVQTSFKKRLPWMVVNLATAFLAASVVGLFQRSISEVVTLAVYMPVVAGMGGNVATQTLTVITRGIALGELEMTSALGAIGKQIVIGVGIGAVTGLITTGVAVLWQGNPYLGLVLFLAMVLNMMVAGLVGAAVPVVLRALKQDPAMGSGVIMTTFTDVCGFLSFLGLATLFLDKLK